MLLWLLLAVAVFVVISTVMFGLGWYSRRRRVDDELLRLRARTFEAERRVHDLVRQGVLAIIDEAQRHQRP